jgi:hypothetical protein
MGRYSVQLKRKIVISISLLVIFSIFNTITANKTFEPDDIIDNEKIVLEYNKPLDEDYIFNITSALSNIIFTEYNEENGEIAKGRAFGTKGERKAAEIIYENMTNLNLFTTLEKLEERPWIHNDDINHKLEVSNYILKINNKSIDCYPAPSWKGLHESESQLNITFNFTDCKIVQIPKSPFLINNELIKDNESFFFIDKDQWNDPNGEMSVIDIIKPYLDPLKFYMIFHMTTIYKIKIQTAIWYKLYPNCKGLILYDFNKNCHDMIYFGDTFKNSLPVIFINGSMGNNIVNNIEDYKMDFFLQQKYNTSVESYNIIGQLNGSDQSKTVIISSFYDCWWNQGTADSAIGTGIVLAIAKYFYDNNITPKYTIKFIAFSGEEYNYRGARYYESTHKNENIICIIDLNQLGFTQEEPYLTLDIVGNNIKFLNEIWDVAVNTKYIKRNNNETGMKKILWMNGAIPSNTLPFAINRKHCNAVSFFKDGGWILHHRDGMNHSEGDVLKYYNEKDVRLTGELILNITKYLTIKNENNSSKKERLKNENSNKNIISFKELIYTKLNDLTIK